MATKKKAKKKQTKSETATRGKLAAMKKTGKRRRGNFPRKSQ
jgi:hypothetical protein